MTAHRFADAIKAWADGEPIQFQLGPPGSKWQTYSARSSHTPPFNDSLLEWRRKPEPIPDRVYYGAIPSRSCTAGVYCTTPATLSNPDRWAETVKKNGFTPVKLTIRTDDNGVETSSVELI